jgi:hypothetical protein
MKSQAPNAVGAVATTSRLNTTRDSLQRDDFAPFFKWETFNSGGIRRVRIVAKETGGGDFQLRMPFRTTNSVRAWQNTIEEVLATFWTVDLDSSIIDLAINTGGRVDGLALSPSIDYLLWGFLDPLEAEASRFKGFGVTATPLATYTANSNGAKGSLTTFTLAGTGANRGFRFSLGSRVIVREGVGPTSLFNQGKVIARTISTVQVLLDNNALYGNALVAAAGVVWQRNNFEPRMPDTGGLYPKTGTETKEFSFCYLGMIQTDTGSNIIKLRYRGDPYFFASTLGPTFRTVTVNNATNTVQLSLARYMPVGAYSALLLIAVFHDTGAGTATGFVAMDASQMAAMYSDDVVTINASSRARGIVPVRAIDSSIYVSVASNAVFNAVLNGVIQGFTGWEW